MSQKHFDTIEIGEALKDPRRVNVYEITVTNMHGDADLYTKVVCLYPQDKGDEVIKQLNLIQSVANSNAYLEDRHEYECLFVGELGLTDRDAEQFVDRWVEWDNTNDGNTLAAIDSWQLIYYNHEGNPYVTRVIRAGEKDSEFKA